METRLSLGTWPTPVEPAPRLAMALGLGPDDLVVKRDDLTGLGGGGNKVRKLEYTVGAAVADGADTLVTTGAPQSNHARLTAAAAARAGLNAILVFPGEPEPAIGNLVLDALFGARIVWAGDVDHDGLAGTAAEIADSRPGNVLIPFGGSSPAGALGYVDAGRELRGQVPDLDTVVVALGSGGTTAGLVAALGPRAVLAVHTGALADPLPVVTGLLDGLPVARPIRAEELRLRLDQVGPGYATQTDAVAEAMLLAARTEGIVLDPVYTGRALAGLVAAVADGTVRPGARTVFLHTGGLPGLFGHPQALARAADGGLA
ncbi:pyridoxal-phosphate dependent enzyme [Actinomycetospora termitidis]|uniref:Pyridoxal-phosphate dependent enzyme n=1 Tax=Actinomycetospora termitidis TaxID=3053470 RepID=A0ABT7M2J3_9PSEU|nr:pyridoxal-phosphate dependent enzyme [Actinomycetospora sp. Odt1-22]MDL5154890.1 pyridoxal-phosphate dependent enzyme [Actinomycetospora sp. Odt1-22]